MSARPYIGGQAIVEGVMMRAPRALAAAVRKPNGEIAVMSWPYRPITDRLPVLKAPVLRGGVILVESLVLGMRALNWSADQAVEAEAEAPRDEAQKRRDQAAIAGTLAVSLGLGVLFFVALPHLLTQGVLWLLGLQFGVENPLFHVIAGTIKLMLFLSYLWTIGRLPDVQRLFQYHGAEHMSIYAWEAGQDLDVPTVRSWQRFHPRCGTSFLLFVVVASILVFAPFFALMPPLPFEGAARTAVQILIKIPLMLPIAGLAYEAIRLSSRLYAVPAFRVLLMPGLWLQRLTTRDPDDAQLEVAIHSLNAAWEAHVAQGAADDMGLEGAAFQTGAAVVGGSGPA